MLTSRTHIRQLARTATVTLAAFGASAAFGSSAATAATTELFYATTPSNVLVSYTAQAPSRLASSRALSGMEAGETILGMDQRPATGQLYALSSTGRLLVIERNSGAVKRIGTATIPRTGSSFGFDFNPVGDRIRIVSDADQNIRVHPDTGALLDGGDTNLAYKAGDAGAGSNPNVTAVGYTGSAFGGVAPTATTEYGIDVDRNTLVKVEAPNAGTLVTVGALGADVIGAAQLDVAGDGTKYAAFARTSTGNPELWRVADSGAATKSATVATLPLAITSMAAVGPVDDDSSAPLVAVGNYTIYRNVWLSRGLRMTTACNEACVVTVTLRIGGVVAGSATESMNAAGTRAPRIVLTATGRRLAAGSGNKTATLTFVSRDPAGLTRTQVSTFVSKPRL